MDSVKIIRGGASAECFGLLAPCDRRGLGRNGKEVRLPKHRQRPAAPVRITQRRTWADAIAVALVEQGFRHRVDQRFPGVG